MKLLKLSFIFLLVISMSSCFTTRDVNISEGMEDYLASEKAISAIENYSEDRVEVVILAPEICGCYFEKTTDETEKEEKAPYRCLGFPVNGNNPEDDIKKKIEEDGVKSSFGMLFTDFGDNIKDAMERHLRVYFKEVSVEVVDAESYDDKYITTKLDYYSEFARTDNKYLYMKMQMKGNGSTPLDVTGEGINAMGNGHLAWMIPVGILTFPLGFAIGAMVLENVETQLIGFTVAEAIDNAAAEMSKKIAESPALARSGPIKIVVSM